MLARRETGEPLAYILGRREFYGREFAVTRDVLIPRPETEAIVEAGLRADSMNHGPRVIEVGTGSGAVAVTLALERPHARVVATDVSAAALAVARRNARNLSAGVEFVQADLLRGLRGPFDVVVANLPYVPDGERDQLQREIRDWEPDVALFAGTDGLQIIARLIRALPGALAAGGVAVLECMARQLTQVTELGWAEGFAGTPVLQGDLPVGVELRRSLE
jgi:release factor glutamine methyltransferase